MTEVGANSSFFGGSEFSNGFALIGQASFGTRYYYDRNVRISKSKKVLYNSGNFLQFIAGYSPAEFSYISVDDRFTQSRLQFIPSWGGRRNFGSSRWSFEGRMGVGYARILDNHIHEKKNEIAYDLRLSKSAISF